MVYYCSVSKGNQVLYSHSVGDLAIESLAALCLNKVPPYHKFYFQTMGENTFGFLVEDGFIYFAIADKGLRNIALFQFLNHIKDEYKKLSSKKGSRKNISNLQEQLVPVILRLITSLEHVSPRHSDLQPGSSSGLSPSLSIESNGEITKALLLSKSSKKEKKKNKNKEHVIGMRGIEIVGHQGSNVRGGNREIESLDPSSSLNKDVGYVRTKSINGRRKKWCRLVRIILAIDIVVCLVLLGVWLVICGGIKCLR